MYWTMTSTTRIDPTDLKPEVWAQKLARFTQNQAALHCTQVGQPYSWV